MKKTLEYKEYKGSIEFSEEDNLYFGKVLGISSLISYEGSDIQTLITDFQEAIDYYLDICGTEELNTEQVN